MSECRPHPAYLVYDAKKLLPFFILPALRILFSPRDAVYIVLSSLRDLSLVLVLFAYDVWKWRRARYRLDSGLTVRQVGLVTRRLRVTAGDAASVEMERTFLLWLLGGRRLRINTAVLRRRADATLYLSAASAKSLMNTGQGRQAGAYAARPWPVAAMAASSSNAAMGLLTLAPAIRQFGRILGRDLPDRVYGLVGRVLSLGLPPLLEGVANVFVIGWMFAFLRGLLRYAGFFAQRKGEALHLASGLITRRNVLVDTQKITALELRQTLFMRLFRLHTATITAAGYGRERGARPVIVPAARARELCAALDRLLPEYPVCASSLRPGRRSLPVYVVPPLLVSAAGLIPMRMGGVWTLLSAVWLTAGLWWFAIRLSGFLQAGFGVGGGAVTLRYSRGLALYQVHLPVEVADCVLLKRSPWQRRAGTCTVEVRCFGEKRRRHRVRALPYEPAAALVERLNRETAAFRR